jgi:hypothetical protein
MANNVLDKIERHAKGLEAVADQMEKDGIGLHTTRGHVSTLRRMAGAMRVDAAAGKLPHQFNDNALVYAGAANAERPLPGYVTRVLATAGVQLPANRQPIPATELETKLAAASVSVQDRIACKQQLAIAGLLA